MWFWLEKQVEDGEEVLPGQYKQPAHVVLGCQAQLQLHNIYLEQLHRLAEGGQDPRFLKENQNWLRRNQCLQN
jgi:hypothetical protein